MGGRNRSVERERHDQASALLNDLHTVFHPGDAVPGFCLFFSRLQTSSTRLLIPKQDASATLLFRVHKFGHSAGLSGFIDAGEDTGALGQQDAGVGAFELVGVFDAGAGDAAANSG